MRGAKRNVVGGLQGVAANWGNRKEWPVIVTKKKFKSIVLVIS